MNALAAVTPIKPGMDVEWMSPADVAAYVPGLTVENLQELRKKGAGPAYFKPTGERGKVVLYARGDVDDWIWAGRHTTREQS